MKTRMEKAVAQFKANLAEAKKKNPKKISKIAVYPEPDIPSTSPAQTPSSTSPPIQITSTSPARVTPERKTSERKTPERKISPEQVRLPDQIPFVDLTGSPPGSQMGPNEPNIPPDVIIPRDSDEMRALISLEEMLLRHFKDEDLRVKDAYQTSEQKLQSYTLGQQYMESWKKMRDFETRGNLGATNSERRHLGLIEQKIVQHMTSIATHEPVEPIGNTPSRNLGEEFKGNQEVDGDAIRQAIPEERSEGGVEDPTLIALGGSPPRGAMDPRVVDSDLRSARSMAGVPNNAAPQQQQQQQSGVVRGYGGSTFLGNDDLQSQAAGNYNPYPGNGPRGPPAPRPGGDVISNPTKQSRNNTTDSLRPYFRLGGPSDVSPSESQQLATRILHTDFGTVVPGSGLGVTNKLFVMNQLREKNIHYMGQLPLPRPYDGPSGLVVPEPIQWQNLITKKDRDILTSREIARDLSGVLLEARNGAGSLNITGDDFGQMSSVSARGLKRDADSPLEPLIRLPPQKMQRVKLADGFALSHRHTRRLFDAQRYPERYEPNVAQSGGPTYSHKSALALYPFPLG